MESNGRFNEQSHGPGVQNNIHLEGPYHANGKTHSAGPKKAFATEETWPVTKSDKRNIFKTLRNEKGAETTAKAIVHESPSWIPIMPDALVTFVSGNVHFHQWIQDDYQSALQAGLAKLMNDLSLVIFDDGLEYGISKLLGAAIQENALCREAAGGEYKTIQRNRFPALPVGVVPITRLEQVHSADKTEITDEPLFDNSDARNYALNGNHHNFVYVDATSYTDAGLLRIALEKSIQKELGTRSVDEYGRKSPMPVTLVAFVFQGEIGDIKRINEYLKTGTPVTIMDGCGGLGDLLAILVIDSVELSDAQRRSYVQQQLLTFFPATETEESSILKDSVDSLLEILNIVHTPNGDELLSVLDCRIKETFANLSSTILKSAIISSRSAISSPELYSSLLSLAVTCNNADIVASNLMKRLPWYNMELPFDVFEMALLLPEREAFVEMYLSQKFPVRFYLSHLKLLKLFRETKERNFFCECIWEGMLKYSAAQPIDPGFVVADLNKLIKSLTGVHDYLDMYELTHHVFSQPETDRLTADRKAMNALLVFAVLFNRPKLVKIFVKYAQEPLLQALFAESLFHGLYRNVSNVTVSSMLKRSAEEFAKISVDLFDAAVAGSTVRGYATLIRKHSDFNNKTPLELAFDTNNKAFVAHSNVQTWLDQYYFNFIRVKGSLDNLKLFLSALFIFPMYLWLTFPRLRQPDMVAQRQCDGVFRPKTSIDIQKVLRKIDRIRSGTMKADNSFAPPEKPALFAMLREVWAAPVVRFYIWHLFYWMFVILICVDMMLPPCRFIGIDIVVWVTTVSMWLEIVSRTMYDIQCHRRVDRIERIYDLVSQTLFSVLFFLYRIYPYRYDHPFAGRVILAFGVLYYCYRIWSLFYYMERTLGPLIRITGHMFTRDLSRWIVLVAPFAISTAVIWQGVLNPDWPANGDDWRHAFYRGVFTLFGAFSNELDYGSPACSNPNDLVTTANHGPNWRHKNRWGRPDGVPPERCWSGDYNNYTCPTISFWSYFFVIQYYVFLKLGMANMLTAFYVSRNLAEAKNANLVWKYHRCRIILDYGNRSSLPPPFSAFGYFKKILKACLHKKGRSVDFDDSSATVAPYEGCVDESADAFSYWKGVALEYFRRIEQQEAVARASQRQTETLMSVQSDLRTLSRKVKSVDSNVYGFRESNGMCCVKLASSD